MQWEGDEVGKRLSISGALVEGDFSSHLGLANFLGEIFSLSVDVGIEAVYRLLDVRKPF